MSADYLASLLNKIDKTEGKAADVHLVGNVIEPASSSASNVKVPDNWASFPDPTTGKPYYHNYSTGVTQWEKPEGFVELTPAYVQPVLTELEKELAIATYGTATEAGEYAAIASFNKHRGSFANSGADSYWETKGRQKDKAGRQLQAFVDLEELEKNRAETKAMKEASDARKNHQEWLKRNGGDKKGDKKRKAQSWLYED